MSSMSKLFANILEHRLTCFQSTTGLISAEQFGFTKGRRTLDPIFILDTLIDRAKADNMVHGFIRDVYRLPESLRFRIS